MSVMQAVVSRLLVLVVLAVSLASPARAALVPTEALLAEAQQQSLRDEVKANLARAEVQERLVAWGVDLEQAEERIDHLSEAELVAFADEMEQLPAGGLAAALGIVFVVLLVLELVGVIDIFKAI